MHNKAKITLMALCYSPLVLAQTPKTEQTIAGQLDDNAFTFTEAQLGEDDDMSQNVTIVNSNNNIYASQVGYLFSPTRFRYRAFNQKYNEVFINGAPQNDMESGQFRFSTIGGLNRYTRNVDYALPFESNSFAVPAMAGSNNYDFRAGSMGAGNYLSLGGANRNYVLRGMYTYASGFNAKGWAFAGGITYRWANRGYVEGTFYNALSYFLGVQKKWNNGHSLSFTTWGNPTERSTQGAATDETYWLANDYYYNPYWGYQNGKKRNSRVVHDFSPSAILTWDWDISDKLKLTTSAFGKYGMYKSTKLNYSNAENPQPDYWKNLPSSYFNVWGDDVRNTDYALAEWQRSVNWWQASKQNRQINWDALYAANRANNANTGSELNSRDALYYVQAKHNNALVFSLASTLKAQLSAKQTLVGGLILGQNRGRHYQTMEDLLGAATYHNINTYALGTYGINDDRVQYDLNNRNGVVGEGDKFGYDYQIEVRKGTLWANYTEDFGNVHYFLAGKLNYDDMRRKGYMRNGMFADNSYGHSGLAKFLTGGMKFGANIDLHHGQVLTLGIGYEHRAPDASTAFVSPEMNNDFVRNLQSERIFSSELGYQYQNSWLHANVNAYYSNTNHGTEWQNFYFDDVNSFTYVSMTGIKKSYYGVEAGLNVKVTSFLDFKALGTISDAKYTNNADVVYMSSTKATYTHETEYNKGMRESGTPLTATSLGLSFHQGGWFVDLNANWYDRIYLSYSPCLRYGSSMTTAGLVDNNGDYEVPDQAKGHGGWMIDGSIGKSIRLKHGQLNFNLMVTNILNNQHIVTGGYEQSRSSYTVNSEGQLNNTRVYNFQKNPKKYYAFGTNGMFQVSYRF